MTEDIFRKRPILGNRILNPIKDITASRPEVNLNQPEPKTNSNLNISDNNQNSDSLDTINMNNDAQLNQSLKALEDLIDSTPPETPDAGLHADVKASIHPVATTAISKPVITSNNGTKGNIFFKFPSVEPPFGGNIHSSYSAGTI